MASQAYKNNGAIIIWNDETEGTNADDFNHTIMEIVISPLAKGYGYASSLNYTHSSDLKTMQEIFQVGPLLGDAAAAGTLDLSDLFVPNTIPNTVLGDFNQNGTADAADYVVWRKNGGTQAGYEMWRANVAQHAGSGSSASSETAISEPTTLVLLMFATSGWCLRRRRAA